MTKGGGLLNGLVGGFRKFFGLPSLHAASAPAAKLQEEVRETTGERLEETRRRQNGREAFKSLYDAAGWAPIGALTAKPIEISARKKKAGNPTCKSAAAPAETQLDARASSLARVAPAQVWPAARWRVPACAVGTTVTVVFTAEPAQITLP